MNNRLPRTQTKAPSILVAENEPTSRMSLSELLREEGYQVVEAADSGSAITQIRKNVDLNIILSNLEMPTWKTVIEQGRFALPQAFIVGMVRYGALPNALEAQRLGADGYLVKPLSFNEVNQWIQRFLTGQSLIKS
ncbi:MAG: response regulator [Candidatus Binatia bacterium]